MAIATRSVLFTPLVSIALACGGSSGGGDGGPVGPSDPGPVVAAGTYAATFTSTSATGCGDLVPLGSTDGNLVVTQEGEAVTLEISRLSENILNDPTGTMDETGAFTFQGPIEVGNESGSIQSQGTITGTFSRAGDVDLVFSFTAFTCQVDGTITGRRV